VAVLAARPWADRRYGLKREQANRDRIRIRQSGIATVFGRKWDQSEKRATPIGHDIHADTKARNSRKLRAGF
jgi:hypothetical protein